MRKIRKIAIITIVMLCFLCSGCALLSEETVKLRDLDMTVLSEERIPEELMRIIEEKKEQPFSLTYKDRENLFICIGYGEQKTGGYSVAVNELYLTDSSIQVNTSLLGPEKENRESQASYPYIVIRTELLDLPVVFE